MDSSTSAGKRRFPAGLIPVLGYGVSIACLVWVYHGFQWHSQIPKILATDWRLVTLAVVADVCVYVLQGWRWGILLGPVKKVSILKSVQAVYIGLFANEVLPLRSGEVIRCYLQGRWNGIRFSVSLSSAVIERMLDGAWLILGFWTISYFVPLPGYLVTGAKVLALVLGILTVLLVITVIHKKHVHAAVRGSPWAEMLRHVVDGAHDMGRSRSFALATLLSLIYLLIQVIPINALAHGYGLGISWPATAVVLVILRLGSIPPQAPGNVGGFQFFTILGLEMLGVARPAATGFATLLFVVVTVPLWIGGFIALLATKMRLHDIHQRAHQHLETVRNHGAGF